MFRRRAPGFAALLIALAAWPLASPAAEVIRYVPEEALGFVLVRDLTTTDGKVAELMQKFEVALPGPLAFLRLATGIEEGLDADADFLLAVLPGEDSADRPRFCVWLPVSDYDTFVDSLSGASAEGITAVTVAGEDLLLAKQENWALLMDPDQREVMERLLDGPAGVPPQIEDWAEWIDRNDATIVVLPKGLQLLSRIAAAEASGLDSSEAAPQDLDEEENTIPISRPRRAPGSRRSEDPVAVVEQTARQVMEAAPQAVQWLDQSQAIAAGLRIEKSGSAALAGMRIAWKADSPQANMIVPGLEGDGRPPILYRGGDFLLVGEGRLPAAWMSAAAAAYTRLVAAGLAEDDHVKLPADAVERLAASVGETAGRVESVAVLSRPGEPREGVYATSVLAVRVDSSDGFLQSFAGTVELWNEAHEKAAGSTRLVFERRVVQVAGRAAVEYSLDMIAAVGTPDLPEIRQAMEQLFGPEGKFRVMLIPTDDHTVLLTVEPADRAAVLAEEMARRDGKPWTDLEELQPTVELLPAEADWRIFVSPHGYTNWLKRQMDVVLGPVIGGPVVPQYPESPPVGIAGGSSEGTTWIDVAVPGKTLDSAAEFQRSAR